jgi:hypothetical protein
MALSCFAEPAGTYTIADGSLASGNSQIIVEEGFTATILGYAVRTGDDVHSGEEQSFIEVDFFENSTEIKLSEGVSIVENLSFQGPLLIAARPEGYENSLATATIKIQRSKIIADFVPNNSIVIPSDETGDVEIVLERSTDLINWMATDPGTVGSSSDGVFFRVRVVRN